ncbi:MAG: L-threonylcarbamoyladenylate synthase [Acidobacteriota bacterium]|nr:L-threonylcarbamoyladenylate synthase [Acidobacteriota bacterium]
MSFVEIVYHPLTRNRLLRLGDLRQIAAELLAGRLVVLPTETGYLLGADALNAEGVDRVFAAKGRPVNNPIHAAVPDVEAAARLVYLDGDAERLLRAFCPGPMTVVCRKREHVSDLLVAGTGNLGIRIPDNAATLQVLAHVQRPVTATSLNLSGTAPAPGTDLAAIIREMVWSEPVTLHVVVDEQAVSYAKPSTLVAVDPLRILREGPIGEAEIRAALLV